MCANNTKLRVWPWLAALVALTAALSIVLLSQGNEPTIDPARTRTWEVANPRIEKAEQADLELCDKRIAAINEFFEQRKRRSREFAESVLSTEGKARLIWSKLPGTDPNGFNEFVRDEFTRIVLNANDLKALLVACSLGYQKESDAIENELLVGLFADVGDNELFRGTGGPRLDDEAFRKEYQRLLMQILPSLNKGLVVEVGKFAISWVGMDLIMQTAMAKVVSAALGRLVASSGIVGVGFATSVASLGLGCFVGYIIDQIVAWFLKEAFDYDPERDIAQKVNESLEQVRQSLVEGDPAAGAAYGKLRDLARNDPFPAVRDECRAAAYRIGNSGNLGLRSQLIYIHDFRCEARQLALKRLVMGNTPEQINCWPGGAAGRRLNALIVKGSEP